MYSGAAERAAFARKLAIRLHILDGLQLAPAALGMLFRGANMGKLVVRVTDPPG